jgi:hypothetical protein
VGFKAATWFDTPRSGISHVRFGVKKDLVGISAFGARSRHHVLRPMETSFLGVRALLAMRI